MNTLRYKIWADFRLHKTRSLLAVVNIAIGVFCVGTLVGMIDLQLSKMDAAHQHSQPSHINLILRNDADLSLLENIQKIADVAGLDTMTPLTVPFRLKGQTDWSMATVIIRLDYSGQQFDKTALQSGEWPAAGKLAIENLSAQASGLTAGDSVEFDTAQGPQTLQINGTVRHPFVKPPKFGGQLYFFADLSSAELFGVPAHSFRQLLVQTTRPYSADKARSVAVDIRDLLTRQHIGVSATLLQDPEKHWGRPFLAGVNLVLQMMALVSLALASALITNTVAAHITQQTCQIGVMKALGAGKGLIAGLYLSETLLMALAAILLALGPSLLGANVSSCKLLELFNIDCGPFTVSSRALWWMLLGGLFTPLLAALGPVLRGASLTVKTAIASYGLGSDFGSSRFDLWLERLGAGFLPTLYAAALTNLFRHKQRLLLTQSVLIIAGVMFLVLMSLIASLNFTLDNEMARSPYTVRLGFSADQSREKVLAVINSVPGAAKIETWRRQPLEMLKNGAALRQKGALGTQLLAVPASSELYKPLIETGRWLEATDAGQQMLVLSADTAAMNGIQVGDNLDVKVGGVLAAWRVIGLYRWLAGNNFSVEPVYAPLETLRKSGQDDGRISFALVDAALDDPKAETDYLRLLKQKFQENHIKLDVFNTFSKQEQSQFARNQFNSVIGALLGLSAMIASVGGIGLSGALAISVLQRTREIGVMRAIGAPAKAIFGLFLLEGCLHGAVSWLLCVPLAYLASEPLSAELGKTMLGIKLDYAFAWPAVFYWLLAVFLLTCLAAYGPARKAARLTVKESLGA